MCEFLSLPVKICSDDVRTKISGNVWKSSVNRNNISESSLFSVTTLFLCDTVKCCNIRWNYQQHHKTPPNVFSARRNPRRRRSWWNRMKRDRAARSLFWSLSQLSMGSHWFVAERGRELLEKWRLEILIAVVWERERDRTGSIPPEPGSVWAVVCLASGVWPRERLRFLSGTLLLSEKTAGGGGGAPTHTQIHTNTHKQRLVLN